ncbi:MarR family transcriptional regulator [Labrenzia sp. R4_2]|uniref:MarR family winged helix-turn-helix transcriptional regulator n=1 Tax=Labrenzia sp. R4_2 TaxID=2821107 RepID=UPI001ADA108A|nr:MarR family transcriptional regulator [Labrenzia sp. R4_2]MBO9418672.1 MarR family transcriptional regulator [Labrenzia sp. R4_2]
MEDIYTTNALRLMQSADEFRAKLSGEFSAVHGLSVNEYFFLMHLQRAPLNRLSRVELAKRMYVSASTVTRMAAPMEKLGLVTREADIRDARLAYVVLSKAGTIRLGEAKVTFAKHARAAFGDRWSSAELDSLSKLLNRLVAGTLPNLT